MAFKIVNDPIVRNPSIDPQPAAKHFDIVLGLDFHVLKVPWPITPCPITPFAALIFDPMDYIHVNIPAMPVYTDDGFTIAKDVPLGAKTVINGSYRGVAQSALWGMPSVPPLMGKLKGLGKAVKKLNLLHSVIPHPLFLLPKFFHPHEGQLSHGSETVITEGMYQSTFLCRAYSCQDVGKILMNNPTGGFYLNFLTAIMVVLPLGAPVIVGGAKKEQELKFADLVNALMLMGLMKGLKYVPKLLGKMLTKLLAKIEARFPGFAKFRNAVQPHICKYLGEPVDAASGHMASYLEGFSLPGPIPFIWEANYYSNSAYDGPLGKNIYHSYDITLLVDEEMVVMNDTAGRPVIFPLLQPGNSFYNPLEKYELHRDDAGEYHVSGKNGLHYYFNKPLEGSNGFGNLRSIVDRNGFAIRFTYNEKGHLISIKDSADRMITISSDENGLITALSLPNPDFGASGMTFDAVRYTYTAEGNMNGMYNAEGFLNRFAWRERFITARRFNDGTIFTFEYDDKGRCTAALGPDGLYSYTFAYIDGLTIATNSLGHSKKYYHADGVVSKIVNSLGGERLYTYDDSNNLIAESNEIGVATTYEYDDFGNLIKLHLPAQGEVVIRYNELHQPVETVLPNGGVWIYEYDEVGKLLKRVNPLGDAITYEYNADGLIKEITNVVGQSSFFRYDDQYNLNGVLLPNETQVLYYYDALGRCIELNDPKKNTHYRKYNLLGKVTEITGPDGGILKLTYDSMGNLTSAKDRHHKVEFKHDFFGNVVRRSLGDNSVEFVYDKEGQLNGMINEHNEHYVFELDSEGNVIVERGFDGLVFKYLRNPAGQAVQIERPNGHRDIYEYDSAGQIITLFHQADQTVESYAYDNMSRMVAAVNQHAQVVLKRDVMGRVSQEECNGISVNSVHNPLGQRTRVRSSMGADISTTYDEVLFLVEEINANGWQAKMSRNPTGYLLEKEFVGGVKQSFDYDRNANLTNQSLITNNRVVHNRHYSWEGERLKGVTDSSTGDKLFKHDVHGNLSEVLYGDGTVEFRVPDAVGNLFESLSRKDRSYNRGGRLIESSNAVYKYDQQGNLIEKRSRRGEVWQYYWNEAGMLERVVRPDQEEVIFAYDALGRRLWKRFKKTTTRYLWDGNKPLHEWKEFDARESTADEIITWVFNEGNFSPVAKIKGDKKYSIIADQLGTPVQGYSDDGELIWQRELDSYGRMKMQRGDAGFCNYLYQGQLMDPETGLAYNRFRYYNPEEGIYVSQDPIRLLGGSRLYGYVKDTNIWLDPFGLACEGDSGRHSILKDDKEGGQSHHLNQDAAFRDVIPRNKGAAIKLEGDAFREVGSNHYNAHASLEQFWDQYRVGGENFGLEPSIDEYNAALQRSLESTTLTPDQIDSAMLKAKLNQLEYGLNGTDNVPRIPGKINQVKP
ncbi:Rhs family protein [Pedobacter sp. BAL39]|uniref:DUF6531 domain-containing protein n=1 Tax=Pedobacter sp. BAL39 TaxID=391596 RepID=UPI0001559F81|nr:DUF6531 domain-containing protein [Pedobacter sp. BAL39]EDM35112.1 Rhs family protein [Pedobacter sp. BAL39]